MSEDLKSYILQRQLRGRRLLGLSVEENFTEYHKDYIERVLSRLPDTKRQEVRRNLENLSPVTRLQSLPPLHSLTNHYKRVHQQACTIGAGIPETPILATAYGDEILGEVLFSPPSRYAILMDETYQIYSLILGRLVANALQPLDKSADEALIVDDTTILGDRIRKQPECQKTFNECMLCYLTTGTPTTVRHQPMPNDRFTISLIEQIHDAVATSMVGHEYGHIARKHFSDVHLREICSSNELLTIDSKSGLPYYKARQLLEVQADIFSFEVCLGLANHDFVMQLYILGILSHFYMMDLLDLFIMMRVRGKDYVLTYFPEPFDYQITDMSNPASHPSGTIRAGMLIERVAASDANAELLWVVRLIDRMAKAFLSILWHRFHTGLTQAQVDSLSVSERWDTRAARLRSVELTLVRE